MSKGSKRPSFKTVERRFNNLFPKPVPPPTLNNPPAHLGLTDEEIDRKYFYMGKHGRTMLKREAAKARAQLAVKAELEKES